MNQIRESTASTKQFSPTVEVESPQASSTDRKTRSSAQRSLGSTPTKSGSAVESQRFSPSVKGKSGETASKATSVFSRFCSAVSESFTSASRAISSAASKLFSRSKSSFNPFTKISEAITKYQAGKASSAKEKIAVKELISWNQKYETTFYNRQTAFLQGHQCQGYFTAHQTGLFLHLLTMHSESSYRKISVQGTCTELLRGQATVEKFEDQIQSEKGKRVLKATKARLTKLQNAFSQFNADIGGYTTNNRRGQSVYHPPLTEKFGKEFASVVRTTTTNLFMQVHCSYIGNGYEIPKLSQMRGVLSVEHKDTVASRERAAEKRRNAPQSYSGGISYEQAVDPLNPRGFGVDRM